MRKIVIFVLVFVISGTFVDSRPSAESPGANKVEDSLPISKNAAAFGVSQEIGSFVDPKPIRSNSKPGLKETGLEVPAPVYPDNIIHDSDKAPAKISLVPMPLTLLSFDGLTNFDNIDAYSAVILPPDMTGDVGPGHYVQAVNSLVRIYDKNGNAITPPFKLSQLFAPLATVCSTRNDGDPIVLYDPLADRWLISQFCTNAPPFRQMIAVSQTGDPTGAYFLYEFVMPNIRLNDFPKFGVWPDGYYMSTEEFTGSDFSGTGMFAFDRLKMLVGDPSAAYIYFNRLSSTNVRLGNLLPADLDGLRPPPAGAPNVFAGYTATEYGDAQDAVRLFNFHADFTNPLNSTFTERPESPLAVAAFDPTSLNGRADITQPAPGDKLDANSDRLNYRAAYRNLGTGESLVLNQTVRLSIDPYRAGVRVYELRRNGGAFSVAEQSTIGNSSSSRWIGSAATDNQGNLAVGYNFVTDTNQPSINYTGKLVTEPAGTFREEGTLINGTGVQRAFGWRWGDYSGMSVDPTDDCTFWMTGEYYTLASQQFSEFTWLTRIGKFKFPECTAAPRAVITGVVTNSSNGQPIAGASVTASAYSRATGANGSYGDLAVLPGSYQVTASAQGFRPQVLTLIAADGQSIAQNFALAPVPVLVNTASQITAESCAANGAPDPGETVSVAVSLQNTGALAAENLVATLLAGGGVTNPGPPQVYGPMPVGGPAVSRTFSFTVGQGVTCGGPITLTLRLQDGASETIGLIAITLQTGTAKIAFRENFDRSQRSRLPVRWKRFAADVNGNPDFPRNWNISTTRSQTGSKSAFSPDLNQIGLGEMATPVLNITTPNGRLSFRNFYDFETTFLRNRRYDGSVLEISIGGGAWQDIIVAGGTFESGGYDGPIDACCQNPLRNLQGWSGKSGVNQTPEFITTSVRLPANTAGQTVQLRFRVGTDIGNSTAVEGQYIDNLLITDGFTCGCTTASQWLYEEDTGGQDAPKNQPRED